MTCPHQQRGSAYVCRTEYAKSGLVTVLHIAKGFTYFFAYSVYCFTFFIAYSAYCVAYTAYFIAYSAYKKGYVHILHTTIYMISIVLSRLIIIFCIFDCIFCIFDYIILLQIRHIYLHILHISGHILHISYEPLSTNAVNQLKYCMLFQWPPYWGGFLLSRWAILERSPSRREVKQLTFRAQVVTT